MSIIVKIRFCERLANFSITHSDKNKKINKMTDPSNNLFPVLPLILEIEKIWSKFFFKRDPKIELYLITAEVKGVMENINLNFLPLSTDLFFKKKLHEKSKIYLLFYSKLALTIDIFHFSVFFCYLQLLKWGCQISFELISSFFF